LLPDILVIDREGPAFFYVLVQGLEALPFVLRVFRSSDEFLHGFHVEKLMNVVVVSEEIRWDFPSPFELAVFSNHSLDFFHESVFGVVTTDFGGSVVGVLKLLRLCELDNPRGDCNGAVRSRLIEANFQKDAVLEAGD
jgi:hypothetical protein